MTSNSDITEQVKTAQKIADSVNRQMELLMPVLTPLGVVLGLLLPGFFTQLRPMVPWLFGLITLTGALKLRAAEFGQTVRRPVPIFAFFISTHVLAPLCAMAAASLFFKSSPDTISGFVLLFAGPTAVSGFIWVTMYRGDKALCLTLILLDTLLAPLVVPGTVSLLMGTKVTMDMGGIALSLILMVVIPTILGITINETSRGKIPASFCPYLNPISKICLILVIAANSSPAAKIIRFNDPEIWKIAGVCICLTTGAFLLAKLASVIFRCNLDKSITIVFSGGLRNISAVTTIAVTFFPEAAIVPALMGIMFQQTIAALMKNLLIRKIPEI